MKNWIVSPKPNSILAFASPLTISHTPDTPQSFGYKTAWMAIKIVDTNCVIKALEDLNSLNRQVAKTRYPKPLGVGIILTRQLRKL